MKTKFKKCLAMLTILVTCFCVVDNNFIVGKFFASLIIPDAYAINPDEADDSESTSTTDPGVDEDQQFLNRVVEIARSIAADEYECPHFSSVKPKYAYLHGGDGEKTGRVYNSVSKRYYTVYDCRGFVSASIRYAARDLDMSDALKNFQIGSTSVQYNDAYENFSNSKRFGCHKLHDQSELKDGDILYMVGHTELFYRKADGTPMQVGAHYTPEGWKKANGNAGSGSAEGSVEERGLGNSWIAYFRYATESTYIPPGGADGDGEPDGGELGEGRWYSGEYDQKAELDEQVFDFQGNPQKMVYDGTTDFNMWLFTLLSQFLDFIAGLLVSLLINPIMQLLNAIVNFLTNFINYISGLPMGT